MSSGTALLVTGVSGLAAVAAYVGATILGGVLDPHYSQISGDISELTASRAPNRRLLAPVYIAYNVLLTAFGVALYFTGPKTLLFGVGSGLFVVSGLSGVLQVTWFPMDTKGTQKTAAGTLHIAFAGISSVLTLAVTFVYGFAFRPDAFWVGLSLFSFLAGIAIIVTAPFAAVGAARSSVYQGLFERVTIGVFMAWVIVVSVYGLVHLG